MTHNQPHYSSQGRYSDSEESGGSGRIALGVAVCVMVLALVAMIWLLQSAVSPDAHVTPAKTTWDTPTPSVTPAQTPTPVVIPQSKVQLTQVCGNGLDTFTDVALTGSGNIIVVGTSQSTDEDYAPYLNDWDYQGTYDTLLIFDSQRRLVSITPSQDTQYFSLDSAPDGTVVVAGQTSSNGVPSPYIARLNPDGKKTWEHTTFTEAEGLRFTVVAAGPDGGFTALAASSVPGKSNQLIKFGKNGAQEWATPLPTDAFYLTDMDIAPDNSIYVVGSEPGDSENAPTNAMVVKVRKDGFVDGIETYGKSLGTVVTGVKAFNEGAYLSGLTPSEEEPSTQDGFLAEINTQGEIVWGEFYGGNGRDALLSLDLTGDGLVAVGYSASLDGDFPSPHGIESGPTDAAIEDALIAEFSKKGEVRWFEVIGGTSTEIMHKVLRTPTGILAIGSLGSTDGSLPTACGDSDGVLAYVEP